MPPKKKTKTEQMDDRDPVFEVTADEDAPDLCVSSKSLFDAMVYPVAKSVFMESIFRKRALHISSTDNPSRVRSIIAAMDNLEPQSILRETSSDNVFVWILDANGKKIQSIEVDNVESAAALHAAGHATYCRASPQVEQPMVANMLRGTGLGCGNYDPSGESSNTMGRGEVEVFQGTSLHVTDWHFDFQENFTLQLTGVKKWTLQQGTIKYPLRGCTPHYNAPDAVESQLKAAHLVDKKFQFGQPQEGINAVGEVKEIVMKPGDTLYFPAGMWHRVETMEAGVSINVSLMATNYATLVCQSLHHFLLKNDSWRETIVSGPTSSSDNALEHLRKLMRQLSDEIKDIDAEDILPPIVRHPPALEVVPDGREKDEIVYGDDGEDEIVVDHGEGQGEMDEVVNINTFVAPPEWSPPNLEGRGVFLSSNLASLVKMNDITSFYNGDKDDHDSSCLYVLNVNYAGNDMNESTVRVVLKDEGNTLCWLVDDQVQIHRDKAFLRSANNNQPWMHCLLYYGLLKWCPFGSSPT